MSVRSTFIVSSLANVFGFFIASGVFLAFRPGILPSVPQLDLVIGIACLLPIAAVFHACLHPDIPKLPFLLGSMTAAIIGIIVWGETITVSGGIISHLTIFLVSGAVTIVGAIMCVLVGTIVIVLRS